MSLEYQDVEVYVEPEKNFVVHDFDADYNPHVILSGGELSIYIKDADGRVHEFHFDGCNVKFV
jgi:hypothetical protein